MRVSKILRSLEQFIQTVKVHSGHVLVTECFFNLFLEVYDILEQLEFKLEKNIGIQKHAGKDRKCIYVANSVMVFIFIEGNMFYFLF